MEVEQASEKELSRLREEEYQAANELAGAMGEAARQALDDIIVAVMPNASSTFQRTMIATLALSIAFEEPAVVDHLMENNMQALRNQRCGWQQEPSPDCRKRLAALMFRGN
jgi:hypothetical protein